MSLKSAAPVICLAMLLAAACDREVTAPAQQDARAQSPESGDVANQPLKGLDRGQGGAPIPNATITDMNGTTRDLAEWEGEPLLLNVWATWCAPCVKELPTLDGLAVERTGELAVVALSIDSDGAAAVAPFLAKRPVEDLAVWLDPENAVTDALGARVALPMTVLYDGAGREIWRYYGDRDWTDEESQRLIDEALGTANQVDGGR